MIGLVLSSGILLKPFSAGSGRWSAYEAWQWQHSRNTSVCGYTKLPLPCLGRSIRRVQLSRLNERPCRRLITSACLPYLMNRTIPARHRIHTYRVHRVSTAKCSLYDPNARIMSSIVESVRYSGLIWSTMWLMRRER